VCCRHQHTHSVEKVAFIQKILPLLEFSLISYYPSQRHSSVQCTFSDPYIICDSAYSSREPYINHFISVLSFLFYSIGQSDCKNISLYALLYRKKLHQIMFPQFFYPFFINVLRNFEFEMAFFFTFIVDKLIVLCLTYTIYLSYTIIIPQ